jgi:CHASE3 domain sensor protein
MSDTLVVDPEVQAAIDDIANLVQTKVDAAKNEIKVEFEAVKKQETLAILANLKSRLAP